LEAVHVGLSEDDIGVFVSGGFPDIGVVDADDEGFSLLDGHSVDTCHGFKSHLGHSFLELFLSSVGFGIEVFSLDLVLVIVVFVVFVVFVVVTTVLSVDVGLFLFDLFSHNSNQDILNIKY
jgi:hypothetical protein